jgi:hypothetical protein
MAGFTKIVGQTAHQIAARANNKKTDLNISKLKTYFSKDESKVRRVIR